MTSLACSPHSCFHRPGGIVVGALVRQVVLDQIGVHLDGRQSRMGHLRQLNFASHMKGSVAARCGFCSRRSAVIKLWGEFTHARSKGLQLHDAAEGLHALHFVRHRDLAAIQRQPVRSGHERQVGLQIQRELSAALSAKQ